jgi:hypothetical protein
LQPSSSRPDKRPPPMAITDRCMGLHSTQLLQQVLEGRFPPPGGSLPTASCRVHLCYHSSSSRQLEQHRELEGRPPPVCFNGVSLRSSGPLCLSMRCCPESGHQ